MTEILLQRCTLALVLVLIGFPGVGYPQQEAPQGDSQSNAPGTYFRIEAINPGLPKPDEAVNLATPQACVEHFVLSARREDWLAAARSMNFRLQQPINPSTASRQARRFDYLLNQNLWIDWSMLPDRPDGVETGSMLNGNSPMIGRPRRSITLGTISLDGQDVPIRVERVKTPGGKPQWLFSAQTVDNITPLYEAKGPSWLARQAPEWSRRRLLWRVPVWQWVALVVLFALALLVAWLVVRVVTGRIAAHLPESGEKIIRAIRWPGAILTAGLVSYLAVGSLLTLPGGIAAIGSPVVLAVVVLSATWLAVRVLGIISQHVTQDVKSEDLTIDKSGSLARLTIFRYVLILLIVAIGLSVLLISMDLFRTLGFALLSSAGAAAVILGIAGHAVLGNLIAGVQIALAQPFRIGDTVIVEGYWSRIEELRYAFVVVRTWDERRLVLPLRYFMDHWI